MNLESQVVSLELAKRMEKLGAPRESLFVWAIGDKLWKPTLGLNNSGWNEKIAAFTVAEMGEMLAAIKYESRGFPAFMCNFAMGHWWAGYRNPPLEWINSGSQEAGDDSTEADARAKLWIYLKEKGLI